MTGPIFATLGARLPWFQASAGIHAAIAVALACTAPIAKLPTKPPSESHGFFFATLPPEWIEDEWEGVSPEVEPEEGEDETTLEADDAVDSDEREPQDAAANRDTPDEAAGNDIPFPEAVLEDPGPLPAPTPTRALGSAAISPVQRRARAVAVATSEHTHGWRDTGDTVRCVICLGYYPTAKQCTDPGCGIVAYPFHDCPGLNRAVRKKH